MTPFTRETLHDALLVARIADLISGAPEGTSQRAADAAGSFATALELPAAIERISYLGALLSEAGSFTVAPADRDAPLAAAAFVAQLPPEVRSCGDAVRWHRECWDGGGDPDGLRWDAVPLPAAIVGIARRFAESLNIDSSLGREGAAFELLGASGRRFKPSLVDRFGRYVVEHPDADTLATPVIASNDGVDAVLDALILGCREHD